MTLKEVAALIGLFGVAGTEGSDMMAQFFQKMSGPLAGMGDAFVASLLGLGGSIVNNVQLLATRKLQRVLCSRAEAAYMSVADAVCVPAQGEAGEQPSQADFNDGKVQLQEIRAIRAEMHQQTEAILLASSRMRQASEPLVKCLVRNHLLSIGVPAARIRQRIEPVPAARQSGTEGLEIRIQKSE